MKRNGKLFVGQNIVVEHIVVVRKLKKSWAKNGCSEWFVHLWNCKVFDTSNAEVMICLTFASLWFFQMFAKSKQRVNLPVMYNARSNSPGCITRIVLILMLNRKW